MRQALLLLCLEPPPPPGMGGGGGGGRIALEADLMKARAKLQSMALLIDDFCTLLNSSSASCLWTLVLKV